MSVISNETPSDPGQAPVTYRPGMFMTVNQGTWVVILNAGDGIYNSSDVNADGFTIKMFLAVGTYNLNLWFARGPTRGIIKVDIDGVNVLSRDGYDAALNYDIQEAVVGIPITVSKLYDVKFRVDGKNVASTGYIVWIQRADFVRTA